MKRILRLGAVLLLPGLVLGCARDRPEGRPFPAHDAGAGVTLVKILDDAVPAGSRFRGLNSLAFLGGGDLIVSDRLGDVLLRLTPDGVLVTVLRPEVPYTGAKPDSFKHRLRCPEGVAVDGQGRIWVADTIRNHRVVAVRPDGKVLRVVGGDGNSTHGSGTDPGSFLWPHGVALSPDGRLLVVTDTGNSRVQIFFSPDPGREPHSLRRVVGSLGPEAGALSTPAGVAVDGSNRIYVADYGHDRVVVLDADGRYRRELGGPGPSTDGLSHPYALALGPRGRLAVADYGHDRIVLFDGEGRRLFAFGREGEDPGELRGPTGLGFDATGRLWVVDAFNHRIQVFGFDADAEGTRVPLVTEGTRKPGSLTRPAFPGVSDTVPLTPEQLGRLLAVEVQADERQFHEHAGGRQGSWGRGYSDWPPPFCAWSRHPLHREVVWRVLSYLALHEMTGEAFFRRRATQGLEYLLAEQARDGSYRWWSGETPSDEGSFYVSGLVGEALHAGFAQLGDPRYRDALARVCDWALERNVSPNANYNAFITHPLALYYRLTGNEIYLRKAVRLNLDSIPRGVDDRGAMRDPHNRKTVYHAIIVRGLLRLLSVMPATHPDRAAIDRLTRRLLRELEARQLASGAFLASPYGAEPSPEPLLAWPAAVLGLARTWGGFPVDERRIRAAIAWHLSHAPIRDDAFLIRDYLRHRDETANDRAAFRRAFAEALAAHRGG